MGLTSIAVEKPKGELPKGVTGSPIPKIGYYGWKTWELHFDNVRAPVQDRRSGEEGRAFYGMARGLESARAHTAARSIGLAQGALEEAIAYSRERIPPPSPRRTISPASGSSISGRRCPSNEPSSPRALGARCGDRPLLRRATPPTASAGLCAPGAAALAWSATREGCRG